MNIREDDIFLYTQIEYDNRRIHIRIEKSTGYISVNMDDVVKAMDFGESFVEYISSDCGLDFINEWNKRYPNTKLFGESGILEVQNGEFILSTKNL